MDKVIFLFWRKDGVHRQDFFSHYIEVHSPLGLRLTLNLNGYTVNLVETEGGPDAITEIWTTSAADFRDPSKSYASQADADQVLNDHKSFIGRTDIYVVEERVLWGEPLDTPLREATPEAKLGWLFRHGDSQPQPPPGARRVVDNRVRQQLVPASPDLAMIRMAWAADVGQIGDTASDALQVREYRHRSVAI
jgi:hypothetical protein